MEFEIQINAIKNSIDPNKDNWENIDIIEWWDIMDEKEKILSAISWPLEEKFIKMYQKLDNKFVKYENYIHKTTTEELKTLKDIINQSISNSKIRENTRNEIQLIKDEEYKLNPKLDSITNKTLFLNTLEGHILKLFKHQMSKWLDKAMKIDPANPDYINLKYTERLDIIEFPLPIPKEYLPTNDLTINLDFSSNIMDKELKGLSTEYNLNEKTVFEWRISTNWDFYIWVKSNF